MQNILDWDIQLSTGHPQLNHIIGHPVMPDAERRRPEFRPPVAFTTPGFAVSLFTQDLRLSVDARTHPYNSRDYASELLFPFQPCLRSTPRYVSSLLSRLCPISQSLKKLRYDTGLV